ncbi:hypothetical protein JCM10213_006085 [Rhodosporidiobolus nylandii]
MLESAEPFPSSGTDFFAKLPAETIRHIFDYAYVRTYGGPVAPNEPLSKRLAAFFYEQRYRVVSANTDDVAALAHHMATKLLERCRFVRQLHVRVLRLFGQQEAARTATEDRQVIEMLKLLLNLTALELDGVPALLQVILSSTLGSYLRRLSFLRVTSDDFSVEQYIHLSHFPSLQHVKLVSSDDLLQETQPVLTLPPLSGLPSPAFAHVATLDLEGHGLPLARDILASCAALSALTVRPSNLDGVGEHEDPLPLLLALPNPRLLTSLDYASYVPRGADFYDALLRFPNLTHLELRGKGAQVDDSTMRVLSSLPLSFLALSPSTGPSFASVDRLLREQKTLRCLRLDVIYCMRGRDWGGGSTEPMGWILPGWYADWSADCVERLRATAKEAGVRLCGRTLAAPEVERSYRVEKAKAEQYREEKRQRKKREEEVWRREMVELYGEDEAEWE